MSSTVVTNSTPPTASAPTIMNNNSDICKIGIGASVQNNVLGLASGYVVTDEFCETLRASRAMYQYGMKVAAVALLCQDPRVWDSMLDAGTPCPAEGAIGAEAATYWKTNPDIITPEVRVQGSGVHIRTVIYRCSCQVIFPASCLVVEGLQLQQCLAETALNGFTF